MGRRHRKKSRRRERVLNIAGAEKKLRQAEFFLSWLEEASQDPAYLQPHGQREHLEFYFSACLTAAQSTYYVLRHTGGATFQNVQREWRKVPANNVEQLDQMVGLRDEDVHFAETSAEQLPKAVPARRTRHTMYSEGHVIEHTNPAGETVRESVLQGAVGLFFEQRGQLVEATTACRTFIGQLRSFLQAMKAASK